MGNSSEFHALIRFSSRSATVTWMSGAFWAITAIVGPPTYPAPTQQIFMGGSVGGARRADYLAGGGGNDLQVELERPHVDVPQIVIDALAQQLRVAGHFPAEARALGEPRDAGLHIMPPVIGTHHGGELAI